MRATRMPVLILALLALAATPAAAQVQLPAQPQTASLDPTRRPARRRTGCRASSG